MKVLVSIMLLTVVLILNRSWSVSAVERAGSAPQKITVELLTIDGEYFVVKNESGQERKVHVSKDTEQYGHFKPGDVVEMWVLPNGHAKTVLIVRAAEAEQDSPPPDRQHSAEFAERP